MSPVWYISGLGYCGTGLHYYRTVLVLLAPALGTDAKGHHLTNDVGRQMVANTHLGMRLRRNIFCKRITSGTTIGIKIGVSLLELV